MHAPIPRLTSPTEFAIDSKNVGDALALLRTISSESKKLIFWDPQYRQLLDQERYGNEGISRGQRRKTLPAMSQGYIGECDREISRILVPSGYVGRWTDEFQLLGGLFKIDGLEHVGVIHWDGGRSGMGGRIRNVGGSLVFLQKPPIGVRAKILSVRWATKPMIRGVHHEAIRFPRSGHPHRKPIGLIAEIILAVTDRGDTIVDPAAGSFVTMVAALGTQRHFLGTDISNGWRNEMSTSANTLLESFARLNKSWLRAERAKNEKRKMNTIHDIRDDNSADVTGHYVITAYRHSGKITFVETGPIDLGTPNTQLDPDDAHLGHYARDGEEICLSPPRFRGGKGRFLGDWYYHLNDGHLHVGPFTNRAVAITEAKRSIEGYRDVVGGRVRSIIVAD
jgi:site-specific DNA-methyltransferase (adenine-specific)